MITKINEFKRYLINEMIEDPMNGEKEINLKKYEDEIAYYNSNKEKFKSIFTKAQEKWEEDANKIINGNKYLGLKWKMDKINQDILVQTEKLKSEISEEDKSEIQNTIKDSKDKLLEVQYELNKSIKTDLETLKKL